MLTRKRIPQVSLRTFFLATFIFAVATQATVAGIRQQIELRRERLVQNFHEQLITSRRMSCPVFSARFLAYVEQTVIAADDNYLPRHDKQRMLESLSAERGNLRLIP